MEKKPINWLAFIFEDNSLSLGRIMAWVMFGILIYMWLAGVAVPETLITTFFVLISYNFGKKLTTPLGALLTKATEKKMGVPANEIHSEEKKEGEFSK